MSEAENIVPIEAGPKSVYSMISEVTAALAVAGVSKDQTNQHDRYAFRGIDDIYNALAPLLPKVGLLVMPRVISRDHEMRQAKSGGMLSYVTVNVDYDFISSQDGSIYTVNMVGEGMDRSDKATTKALSAAYKYACFQAFCIPTEGSDADQTSPELGKQTQGTSARKAALDGIDVDEVKCDEYVVALRESMPDKDNVDYTGMAQLAIELVTKGDLAIAVADRLAAWQRTEMKAAVRDHRDNQRKEAVSKIKEPGEE